MHNYSMELSCYGGVNCPNYCEDIDECLLNQYECPLRTHMCVNTPGSYKCDCIDGLKPTENGCEGEFDLFTLYLLFQILTNVVKIIFIQIATLMDTVKMFGVLLTVNVIRASLVKARLERVKIQTSAMRRIMIVVVVQIVWTVTGDTCVSVMKVIC